MRAQRVSAMIGFCAFSAACTGVAPTAPSISSGGSVGDVAPSQGPARSSIQRVEEGGGGGGGQCLLTPVDLCVKVTISSGATLLQAETTIHDPSPSITNFSMTIGVSEFPGGINQTPVGSVVGRFSDGTLQVSVLNGLADVALALTGPFDVGRTLIATGSGPVTQSQTACVAFSGGGFASSVKTTTTIDLQYLGRTEIVITRTMFCTP
jgi:hypothetical protein